MFQNGQRVCFKNGGDPARIQKVQLAYGKDRSRAPQVIPTTDTNATQVQVVTGEDAARYPFIDPIGLIGAPAAWFRADTGVTVTGLGVSTWADQSGNGRDLLQSTDASRPPYLSYAGTKYLYLPGVAGNYASTPDSVPASITGDIDIRVRVSLDDWTPAARSQLISKYGNAGDRGYYLAVTDTGALISEFSGDGTAATAYTSSDVTGFANGTTHWVRITHSSTTGAALFYTSDDDTNDQTAVTWTQLGNSVAGAATTIFNGTATVEVGARTGGATHPTLGKIYRASIYSTIGGTTPVVDFNPDRDASDGSTSFASSATGETWTVNSSGGLPAQIVGRSSILFDGVADYLKCNAFTLNQPETVYLLFKQVSWANNEYIFDGNANFSTLYLQQDVGGAAPAVQAYAGTIIGPISGPAVGSYGVASVVFNGASSSVQTNNGTATTGNAGAANGGGFTLGARGDGTTSGWSNIQVLEVIIAAAAHDASTRARVIQYLSGRHGVSL